MGVEGGRASWKVTLSSRRWVLYRLGLPHPVLTFFGLDRNTRSRSRFFVFRAILSVFVFAEALATCDLLLDIFHVHLRSNPSTFSPPFFSHGNSNLSDRRVDLSQSSFLSPTPHSCAALYRYIRPALVCSLPPFLSRSLSLPSLLLLLQSSPHDHARLFMTYSEITSPLSFFP